VGASRTKPGSIHALGVAYYASADFLGLKPNTQKTYKGIFDRYRDKYGDNPVALLEARHIRGHMDKMASTPAAANNLLKVLRAVMRFALDRGFIRVDPTIGVRMLRYRSDGFHTWTEQEIGAFEARWPVGTNERLGFDLLLYTAQRSGDVRKMTLQQIRDGRVSVRQEKTGQLVDIPQHPNLQASLAAHRGDHLTLITTQQGVPFTEKGFGNWVSKAAERAGLPHCSAHGLRKAAARRLAEAGCTAHEIMAITGHQSLKEVERYTREAARRGLADTAMKRIG
jgi:integrase